MQARHSRGLSSEPAIATIAAAVLNGLAYVHGEGFMHRDVKVTRIEYSCSVTISIALLIINQPSFKLPLLCLHRRPTSLLERTGRFFLLILGWRAPCRMMAPHRRCTSWR